MAVSLLNHTSERAGVFSDARLTRVRRFSNRRRGAAVAAIAAIALTGCAPDVGGFAVLDQPAQPTDALPDPLDGNVGDAADLATARYVGEHHGTRVWLTRDAGGLGVCLLAYADERVSALDCVTPSSPMEVGTSTVDLVVVPDGAAAPDDATRVSENVYAYG